MTGRWRLPVSRAVWVKLMLGAAMLSAVSLVYWRVLGAVDAMLGSEAAFSGRGFGWAGGAGLAALLALWALRPEAAPAPGLAAMPCGGVMTAASFREGQTYAYCSRRCVHSREDFEARRGRAARS